ncbi:site-specific DNA-methyltransferase [Dehalococcoidia bacterium]|nr:site-specific DNA-methyltransferase [Dehalococcoidia bacterium]MCL0093088.1 site-specific DNA-methyltransferase [Dehalococcoidia bacterium]
MEEERLRKARVELPGDMFRLETPEELERAAKALKKEAKRKRYECMGDEERARLKAIVTRGNEMSIELSYQGKLFYHAVVASAPSCRFKELGSYGQTQLGEWNNRLIKGDNLGVLKTLLSDPAVAGQVKLIYIDPPFAANINYRTGASRTATVSWSNEDETAYEDRLIGEEYLEFLRRRLILLREILAEDGSIYVHIDWKMGHYVKILMDEVFGQERFINDIARIKCNPKNFERKAYSNIKDMLLFYSKTEDYIWNDPREKMTKEDILNLFPKVDKEGRRYTTTPLHAPGETRHGPTGQPWKGLKPPKGRHWRYDPKELDRLDEQGLIEWSRTGNPRKIIYAEEISTKGKKRQDIWEFKDPPYPSYPTEKSLDMLRMILEASSSPGDLVLDCFAGSGTTLVAAQELGRRWIGIDNSLVAIKKTRKRLLAMRSCPSFVVYEAEAH